MKTKVGLLSLFMTLFVYGAPQSYPCNVEFCKTCSFYNYCGLCNPNYILQINKETNAPYCEKIQCVLDNCDQCLEANVCSKCAQGYFINQVGACAEGSRDITCPEDCSYCVSEEECTLCNYGYNAQNGLCYSNVPRIPNSNCKVGFYQEMCQLCEVDYIVGVGYTCVDPPTFTCDVDNCMQCDDEENQCSMCLAGYYLANDFTCQPLECSIDNCDECDGNETCTSCEKHYLLVENACFQEIHACSDSNCIACGHLPEVCTQCKPGFMMNFVTKEANGTTENVQTKCVQITEPSNAGEFTPYVTSNCDMLGYMYTGADTALTIGCMTCAANFINVGGFCTANLTQKNYQCNVANCNYCIQNNYCGMCNTGYYVQSFTGGVCTKKYSPLPNCAWTIFGQWCLACDAGYVLMNSNGSNYCVPYVVDGMCNVTGCSFCLSDNECYECRDGYMFGSDNTTCEAFCDISNCFTCEDDSTCGVCSYGFTLSEDSKSCIDKTTEQTNTSNCSASFGSNCEACTYAMCTKCADGTVISDDGSSCCAAPVQNYKACTQYASVCSNQCVKCKTGYALLGNQCLTLPCSIENCVYCFRSDVCIVCKEGFTLQDGVCTSFTSNATCPENCVTCDAEGVCTECLNGYTTFEGQCVCNFQNCLACQGDGFCSLCAYPTIGAIVPAPGCLPEVVFMTLCEVDNCQGCSAIDMCAECDPGYTLQQDGSCTQNNCDGLNNCLLCSVQKNICFLCAEGFIQDALFGKNCVQLASDYSCNVDGCGVCATSETCEICRETYFLTDDKKCDKLICPDNCLFCFENNTCTFCDTKFYLNTNNECEAISHLADQKACLGIDYCQICQTQTEIKCTTCMFGFVPNADQSACIPQTCKVPNCQICLPGSDLSEVLCVICQQGYYLNSYLQCVSYAPAIVTSQCSVYNCLYCDIDNECAFCIGGWNATGTLCETNLFCSDDNCESCTTASNCTTCAANYTLRVGSCAPACDIENCDLCSSFTTCEMCLQTFVLNSNSTECNCPDGSFEIQDSKCQCPENSLQNNNTCVVCTIDLCEFCTSEEKCGGCFNNLVLQNNTCNCEDSTYVIEGKQCVCPEGTKEFENSTCIKCQIDACSSCDEPNNCIQCDATYQKLNGVCIQCNIQNCDSCSSTNYCSQCGSNLQVNTEGSSCVTCSNNNCAVCSSNNVCGICDEGFEFNNNGDTCVTCTLTGCNSCSADNVCASCETGFTLVEGKCTLCTFPCETCSGGVCATCQSPYSQLPLSNGTCFTCSVANCKQCSSSNTATCETCADNYVKNNGVCTLICSTNLCLSCTDPDICEECILGYSPSGNGCKKCADAPKCIACSQSNINICTQCADGYYENGGSCLKCSEGNCAKCPNGADICEQYKGTQVAFKTKSGTFTPVVCNPGCSKCSNSNPETCITCQNGYSLQSGACIPCASTCKTCKAGDETQCLTCYSSAFLNGNACDVCTSSSNCLTCDSANLTKCTSCPYGYSLASNSTCTKGCPANCLSCKSSSFCTICQQGYSANSDGVCLPCLSNCRGCSGGAQAVCISCGQGFFLNEQGTCEACSAFCKSCTSLGCETCVTGYTLTDSFTCAENCKVPCATCSSTDPSKCNSCLGGYTYDSTKFTCDQVTTCTNNVCEVCPFGYILNVNQCVKCTSSCARCQSTDVSKCTSCVDGKYLKNQACLSCPEGCSTCSTAAVCLSCSSGYTLESSTVGNLANCIKCQSPCSQCIGDSNTCTSCISGFQLKGWKCLSTFNFGFTLVLAPNLSEFYKNYQAFLKGIATALQTTNINVVTMVSLAQGSTHVQANTTTTSASNSNAATDEYNSLSSTLANGNEIGGMSITSANIEVNGGTVDTSSNSTNLALILGISIPLGLILIGGIIYFCCSRRNKLNYEEKYEDSARQEFELSNDVTGRAI